MAQALASLQRAITERVEPIEAAQARTFWGRYGTQVAVLVLPWVLVALPAIVSASIRADRLERGLVDVRRAVTGVAAEQDRRESALYRVERLEEKQEEGRASMQRLQSKIEEHRHP